MKKFLALMTCATLLFPTAAFAMTGQKFNKASLASAYIIHPPSPGGTTDPTTPGNDSDTPNEPVPTNPVPTDNGDTPTDNGDIPTDDTPLPPVVPPTPTEPPPTTDDGGGDEPSADPRVTQIDLVTTQGSGALHPDQVAIERTLQPGKPQAEVVHMSQVPVQKAFGLANVSGSKNVYVTDRQDGSIWEIEPDSGKAIRHFAPSSKPSNEMQGIATGLGEDVYVYYNGDGIIQRLQKSGKVVDSFKAPTMYGHSLAYLDGYLYLLDDRGTVYQINAWAKQVSRIITLKKPDGTPFEMNDTFTLMWDGKYWNVANAQDSWKLYRYDNDWNFHDTVDLKQWSMQGAAFTGQEYLAMNNDKGTIYTIRMVDDSAGEVDAKETQHYQYIGNLLTTTRVQDEFPRYEDRNISLIYNDKVDVTQNVLKPYVSYLDTNGNRIGDMFDSFVFLPSSDGAQKYFYKKTDLAAWTKYLNKTMRDIDALDKEWAEKNNDTKQLGKAKVFLAVPYPNPDDPLEKRIKAIHDYLDQASELIHSKKFAQIEFRGFYWYNEDVAYNDSLAGDFNRYVHQKGLLSLWIPYYSAQHAVNYAAVGFDEVIRQPNYFFKDQGYQDNLNRFYTLAWTGARYGVGVEMELDEKILGNAEYRDRFRDYLHYGLVEGFLSGTKAWYDNYSIGELYKQHNALYDTIHKVVANEYAENGVTIVSPREGDLTSTSKISIIGTAKIRLDVHATAPYSVRKVVLHTEKLIDKSLVYYGPLRVDEELIVKDGKLVKQEIGGEGEGLRIGFNVPLDDDVQVSVVPNGMTPFSDIGKDNPATEAILALSNKGIVNGIMEKDSFVFQPQGSITRAEFAVMLTRAFDLKAQYAPRFADAKNQWYANAVAAVAENEFMRGKEDNRFRGDDTITQEEVAVTLMRILAQKNVEPPSSDTESLASDSTLSPWAQQAVEDGRKLHLFDDRFGLSAFQPQAAATRADVAMVLYKLLSLLQ